MTKLVWYILSDKFEQKIRMVFGVLLLIMIVRLLKFMLEMF